MSYRNFDASKRKSALPETHFVSGKVYSSKSIFEKEKEKNIVLLKNPINLQLQPIINISVYKIAIYSTLS